MEAKDRDRAQVTTEQLIADTVEALRDDESTDKAILDLLVHHVLREKPKNTAVDDALGAIEKLAEERAAESGNGLTDHD